MLYTNLEFLSPQVVEVPQKARKKATTTKADNAKAGNKEREEEQEWQGIDDNPEGKTIKKAKRKQKKRKEKRHTVAEAAAPQVVAENAFALLPDEDEDGETHACLIFGSIFLISLRSLAPCLGFSGTLSTGSSGLVADVIHLSDSHPVGGNPRNRGWPRFHWKG